MATLTAWKFDTPTGADAVLLKLTQLEGQALIQIHEAKELQTVDAELISANFAREQESQLGEAFGLEG
jgi:uncharacterized membrane protein